MSTFLQLNPQFTGSVEPSTNVGDIRLGNSGSEIPNLQSQVTNLTNSINDEAVRLAVGKVLADLVFLLDYLSLVDGLKDFGAVNEIVAILNTVRGEAYSLAAFIENRALRLERLDARLGEKLDSTAYAINHEVDRIFDGELARINLEQDNQETRGALVHAQGVLTNCFQQCMIDFARVFDATITDAGLFQDWQSRRESSLNLYYDLSKLIALVQASERVSFNYLPGKFLAHLEERLTSFRDGSMRSLMYKDWQEYEALLDEIIASVKNGKRADDLLHQMGCYLETLLAHVKARSILADLTLDHEYL